MSKMEDYEVIHRIGQGVFGASFLVLHKTQNSKNVLKKICLSNQTDKFKRSACQEMALVAKLRHPYLVEYKDAWLDKGNNICIVTNYCEGGDISGIIRKSRRTHFSEEKLCKWLTQLLLVIDYLHSNRILHRDLKLSNIFLTKENDIRLGDFGLAKVLDEGGLTSSVFGTPNYMCPEVLAGIPYGYKSDIWSLGCCMFEIAAHQQAFRAADMTGLINKINKSLIAPLPIIYSSTLKQIIKSMLRKSPEHRPTAAELLRHPHLQPFLLRCPNPSTVFLPVKSPAPKNTKEKMKKPSPVSNVCKKEYRERDAKLEQKNLLPLFDNNNADLQFLNLLEGDVLIEECLETTRVGAEISCENEGSKSGSTGCEATDCKRDGWNTVDSSSTGETVLAMKHSEKLETKYMENTVGTSFMSEEITNMESDIVFSDQAKETERSDACAETSSSSENHDPCTAAFLSKSQTDINEPHQCEGVGTTTTDTPTERDEKGLTNQELINGSSKHTSAAEQSKGEGEIAVPQRADALESLLELCAVLLKQDKYNELSGVLKPFGEDLVSSRETAIWLTKSLMDTHKLSKET